MRKLFVALAAALLLAAFVHADDPDSNARAALALASSVPPTAVQPAPLCNCGGNAGSPNCTCADGECKCILAAKVGASYAWRVHPGKPDQLDLEYGGRVVGAVFQSSGIYWTRTADDWTLGTSPYALPPGVAVATRVSAPTFQPQRFTGNFGGGCSSGHCGSR